MNAGANELPSAVIRVARFGVFELDLRGGSLRRAGEPVELQQQQLLILTYLVRNPAKLITREELQTHLWPSGTFVEFELGLNTAINRLRRALGDSASEPRYIETIPKQGYRFICHVSFVLPVASSAEQSPPAIYPQPRVELAPLPPPTSPEPSPNQEVPFAADLTAGPIHPPVPEATAHHWRNIWTRNQYIALAVLAGVLLGCSLTYALFRLHASSSAAQPQVYRYAINLPQGHWIPYLTLSPSGDQIVYEAQQHGTLMLYRRFLDEDQSRPIAGTENAHAPFFSPNGQSLGFFAAGQIKVLNSSGIRSLAAYLPTFDRWNAVWGADGFIYFNSQMQGSSGWVWRVRESGGTPERLLDVGHSGHGDTYSFPVQLLSGNRPVLLYSTNSGPVRRSLAAMDLTTRATKVVLNRGWGGQVLSIGQLVYYRDGNVMAVPFNTARLQVTGSPVEVIPDVVARGWMGAQMSIANNGTLVYLKERPAVPKLLEWVDLNGHVTPLPLPPASYEQAEVSPDGKKLAMVQRDGPSDWSLFIYDLKTGSLVHLLGSKVPRLNVAWSPDNASVVVDCARENGDFTNLFRVPLAAPQSLERLTEQPNFGQFPQCWSAPANAIFFMEGVHTDTNGDILVLPLFGDRRPHTLVANPGWDRSPSLSPDGKWLVYESDQRGTPQVFVQPYDAQRAQLTANPIQLSQSAGLEPVFSPDGRTIYYLDRSNHLLAADWAHSSEGKEPVITRQIISEPIEPSGNLWTRSYSIAPDGRFLLIRTPPAQVESSAQIQVVVNWFEDLKRLTNVH